MLQHLTSENLRINAHPPRFDAAPILSDPVIKTLPDLEISGESTADPRRDSCVSEEGTAKDREVATGPDNSLADFTWHVHRRRVEPQQRPDKRGSGANLIRNETFCRQAYRLCIARLNDKRMGRHAELDRFGAEVGQNLQVYTFELSQWARRTVFDERSHYLEHREDGLPPQLFCRM
jgi:hypothetical protein